MSINDLCVAHKKQKSNGRVQESLRCFIAQPSVMATRYLNCSENHLAREMIHDYSTNITYIRPSFINHFVSSTFGSCDPETSR